MESESSCLLSVFDVANGVTEDEAAERRFQNHHGPVQGSLKFEENNETKTIVNEVNHGDTIESKVHFHYLESEETIKAPQEDTHNQNKVNNEEFGAGYAHSKPASILREKNPEKSISSALFSLSTPVSRSIHHAATFVKDFSPRDRRLSLKNVNKALKDMNAVTSGCTKKFEIQPRQTIISAIIDGKGSNKFQGTGNRVNRLEKSKSLLKVEPRNVEKNNLKKFNHVKNTEGVLIEKPSIVKADSNSTLNRQVTTIRDSEGPLKGAINLTDSKKFIDGISRKDRVQILSGKISLSSEYKNSVNRDNEHKPKRQRFDLKTSLEKGKPKGYVPYKGALKPFTMM